MSNISEISNKNNTIRIHILVILLVVALLAGCDKIEEGNGDTHSQSQLKYIGGSVRRMNDRVVIINGEDNRKDEGRKNNEVKEDGEYDE